MIEPGRWLTSAGGRRRVDGSARTAPDAVSTPTSTTGTLAEARARAAPPPERATAASSARSATTAFSVGRFLRPYRARVALVALLLAANAALGLVNPWLVQ